MAAASVTFVSTLFRFREKLYRQENNRILLLTGSSIAWAACLGRYTACYKVCSPDLATYVVYGWLRTRIMVWLTTSIAKQSGQHLSSISQRHNQGLRSSSLITCIYSSSPCIAWLPATSQPIKIP
uniref:Uncharacterized protein n=1 Tax=Oryza sativa subsp. japonica TaxID=39947 RepID=Q6ZB22_ORYSJ|nr:hypothetical protein [Oryza sativa Japonica Group]